MEPIVLIRIALVAVGLVVGYFGCRASRNVGEQVLETITGHVSDATGRYFVAGGTVALAGLAMLALGLRA